MSDPINFIDPNGLWSISIGGYLGVGGGFTFGRNPDGGYFGSIQGGFGIGGGLGWDPKGKSNDYGGSCKGPQGPSVGFYAGGGLNAGPASIEANTSSGNRSDGHSYFNPPSLSYGFTPSIKFGAGVYGGAEVIFHSDRVY